VLVSVVWIRPINLTYSRCYIVPHHNRFLPQFDELNPLSSGVASSNMDNKAAVLAIITNLEHRPEIIFTRRADHMHSHSGQVSFPGGRWEEGDADLSMTALRETEEEIGLPRSSIQLKGTLQPKLSRYGLYVLPYVGVMHEQSEIIPNPEEIASVFHVPLSYFVENQPDRIDLLHRDGVRVVAPAWNYEDYDIWGLTAIFTQDLLHRLGIRLNFSGVPREKRGSSGGSADE
jgi:8-oxo-dGTP pyrophosphatase MutT (NUDIX family)